MALKLILSTFLPKASSAIGHSRTTFRPTHRLQEELLALLLKYVKHKTGGWHADGLGALVGALLDNESLDLESWRKRKRNERLISNAERFIPRWRAMELRASVAF